MQSKHRTDESTGQPAITFPGLDTSAISTCLGMDRRMRSRQPASFSIGTTLLWALRVSSTPWTYWAIIKRRPCQEWRGNPCRRGGVHHSTRLTAIDRGDGASLCGNPAFEREKISLRWAETVVRTRESGSQTVPICLIRCRCAVPSRHGSLIYTWRDPNPTSRDCAL